MVGSSSESMRMATMSPQSLPVAYSLSPLTPLVVIFTSMSSMSTFSAPIKCSVFFAAMALVSCSLCSGHHAPLMYFLVWSGPLLSSLVLFILSDQLRCISRSPYS